ncbi:MAG: tetratricopeptide repeat protein [Pseudomonadota bacterium]
MKRLLQRYIKLLITGVVFSAVLAGCSSTPRPKGPEIRKAQSEPVAENTKATAEQAVAGTAAKKVERLQLVSDAAELEIDPKVQTKFNTAMDFMAGSRLQDAERILLELTSSHPELSGPYANLGIIYLDQGLLDRAEDMFVKAINANPKNASAHNQYGIVLRTQGRFADAQVSYENALVADPSFSNAHLNLGVLHDLYLQQPQNAIGHYKAFQELSGSEDKSVKIWISDLTRRYGNQRSANASE